MNCDFEMEEELMYCPSCGQEIHLVPEYKIEEVDKVLKAIALEDDTSQIDHLALENELEKSQAEEVLQEKILTSRFSRKYRIALTIGILLALSGIGMATVTINSRNHSYEYQVNKAGELISQEEYENAISHLERAITIDRIDPKAKLMLANTYCALQREDEAIILLLDTIRTGGELREVYETLIKIYESKKEYELIYELLEQSTDMTMKQNFQQYLADVPDFSIGGGVFVEVVPLKLLANASGTIYYTLDGSNPTTSDYIYQSPIFLEDGTYEVRATYENEFGVMSDVISQTYIVELPAPIAPDLELYTGDYEIPSLIRASKNTSDTTIYYTIDGGVPTQNSSIYYKPIPMLLGKHTYQFVAIDEKGVSSEVISRTFNLSLEATYSVNQARELVDQYIFEQIQLENSEYGALSGTVATSCNSAVLVNGTIRYLAIEIYDDGQGSVHRTGNEYFIDVYTGEITRAVWSSTSGYGEMPL